MPKCDKYHAKWKANMAKCSKYQAKCKVTMPTCSKYHAKWQVLVPNCWKYKANGTGKESQKKQNLRQKQVQKLFYTRLVCFQNIPKQGSLKKQNPNFLLERKPIKSAITCSYVRMVRFLTTRVLWFSWGNSNREHLRPRGGWTKAKEHMSLEWWCFDRILILCWIHIA